MCSTLVALLRLSLFSSYSFRIVYPSYYFLLLSLLFFVIIMLSPQDDFSCHGGFVQTRDSNPAGSLRSRLAVRRPHVSHDRRRRSISRQFRGVRNGNLVTRKRRRRSVRVLFDVQTEKSVVQSIFRRDARVRIVL